jgi:DNA repair photolyase
MPMAVYKGRGALGNPQPRFLKPAIESVDDGWYRDEVPDSIATQVRPEAARSIITHNDSPDIPFEQSINPYRGCEHGCSYCQSGDTPILMGDGTTRPLEQIRVGDTIYGTVRDGWYRRYLRTQVLAHWSVIKPAWRITLEDGTEIVSGGAHRFLTERGWKFVTGTQCGAARRPHLTTGNKLMGTGAFAAPPAHDEDYRTGYLCGLIRGDGMLSDYSYFRVGRGWSPQYQFRLALCDAEALERARDWLQRASVETECFVFCAASANRRAVQAIRTHARGKVERVRELTAWPACASRSWCRGFMAGIFDAEGCYSGGILRISNTDPEIIRWIGESLQTLNLRFIVEHVHREAGKPLDTVRLLGGLREHLRFFHTVDPAIMRKRDIAGQAVKSDAKLGVARIEPLKTMRLYDITTGTEDFIANGVVSHNCYARPSHAYMDLSPGIDFETKIFYKQDAARLLEQELGARGYVPKPITIGANTDPYQPVERELKVTRGLLEVLERTRHPLSLITKGTLILRDLDLLRSLAREQLVNVFVSITSLDAELKRTLEPRAASPAARLRVVKELVAAGVPTGVLVAPIIPAVNDCEVEAIVAAVAAQGAIKAGYVLLRLPHELKALFRQWLDEHLPDRADHVMSLIRAAREGRENDPRFGSRMVGSGPWAQLLRDRFALACKRHGLSMGRMRDLSSEHFRAPTRGGQISLPL